MRRRLTIISVLLLVTVLVAERGLSLLSAPPVDAPRTCAVPLRYASPLTFTGARLLYHWTVDTLVHDRMDLYDGTVPLACGQAEEAALASYDGSAVIVERPGIVPVTPVLAKVASALQVYEDKDLEYDDFLGILQEHYREYDCYLRAVETDPVRHIAAALTFAPFPAFPLGSASLAAASAVQQVARLERESARLAHEHLLAVLRGSEQLLPAHVALQCLLRTSLNLRNNLGLLSDISACVPARLWQPTTSLRDPSP